MAIASGCATVVGLILWLLLTGGTEAMPLRCFFNDWTGLHCPGCGLSRATLALSEGRVADAMKFNAMGIVLLPVALLALCIETIGWVFQANPPVRLLLRPRLSTAIAIMVIAFAVLRNLPWSPFTWLAPS
ncbi:DUF2752 domain-containing protein [Sulfuriroseicoccus oceanibius]|uniref:DUF2752 domain-containing protein n=1 Tax=Sulfuriroseicoccus oceanibius TaxID=2707525 RepID=A0A6B3LA81_9BACT|nr:DUF2752 domain-containing protein [Sulfuriroseicoccus oceanibius]QQL45319.1 DUF2752 domain-containing protein [Sulfuriroseicoccus oceanibius]